MITSQNGYSANDATLTQSYKIPGTTRAVRLRKGAPGQLLVMFAAWFDKNVEDIEAGQLDDWGYAERPIRGSTTVLSNHASGTALDLNSSRHPLGERGTFTAAQAAKIRAELTRYDGCIRWGGDYTKRADEMHFEIVRSPADCAVTLAKLTTPPTAGGEMSAADAERVIQKVDAVSGHLQLNAAQHHRQLRTEFGKMLDMAVAGQTAELKAYQDKLDADNDKVIAELKATVDAIPKDDA